MPLSDIRSSETSAQNAWGKNFQKFMCSNFRGFVFRGPYFRVLVMGRENRENLDLAKFPAIRYFESKQTVENHLVSFPDPPYDTRTLTCVYHREGLET